MNCAANTPVTDRVAFLMEQVGCDATAVALVSLGGCNPDEIGTIRAAIDAVSRTAPRGAEGAARTLRLLVEAVCEGDMDRAEDGLDVWVRTGCEACARMAIVAVIGRCSRCQGLSLDREAANTTGGA